ncbi:hypothetical protein [Paractinoplanes rishiriensis]|uniref:Uncharacterized protein n=1 Tax=Paractinoplanes rishiriensis TaxID=1050105 RepID=A0A919JWJ1_9ACTN|nr:hypothetical protein [Actinoplanes rishiriensis]GIE94579.1 hypothetical protein Ari01nite_20440 [Actinoplanes rishiriensis]
MTVQADPARDLVTAAARRAVAVLAPEELPYYEQVAAEWRTRTGPFTPSVSFGIDTAMFSDAILQAVSSAFGELMVIGGTAAGTGFLRWRRKRKPGAEPPAELTEDRITELRDACVRHALDLDLTPDQAEQLADAVVAALRDPDAD